ncbi:MAG: YitT family protein [Lachnospiraceae bacterium]
MNAFKEWLKGLTHVPAFGKKMACMMTGILFMGLTLSILISINLGTDPCSCAYLGVASQIHLSYGNTTVLLNLILFIAVIRYKPSLIGFGTAANMILLGYITDFFRWVWKMILPANFFMEDSVRFGLLLPVLLVFIVSAACYMASDLGVAPYDAIPYIVTEKQNKISFRTFRMLWDISFTLIGFCLGSTVGIVTVMAAFLLGPIIAAIQKQLVKILV